VEKNQRSVKKIEVQKIASRIRLLRRERGLTQQELAALCHFPGPWKISRLEGGKKGSGIERLDTLEIVCQELGIELWELLKPDWDVAGEEEVTK
jgi:transcriptional regulator with XRE-family HTH domain